MLGMSLNRLQLSLPVTPLLLQWQCTKQSFWYTLDILSVSKKNLLESIKFTVTKRLNPMVHRLEQIIFCQCTNFRVHTDVCSVWLCSHKVYSCFHRPLDQKCSKNAPLPGCIQNTDKNQTSMPYVGHCYI